MTLSRNASWSSVKMPRRPDIVSTTRSDPLDDGRVGHTAGLAHRLQPVPTAVSLERVQHGGEQPRTGCAERVPQRDGAASWVQLRRVRAKVLGPGHRNGRERLVDVVVVDLVDLQTGPLQHLFGGG